MRSIATISTGDGRVLHVAGPGGPIEVLASRVPLQGTRVTDGDDRPVAAGDLPIAAAVEGRPQPPRVLKVWRDGIATLVTAEVVRAREGNGAESGVSFLVVEPRVKEEASAREKFVTIASHELKSPIASLQLDLERLRRRLARSETVKGADVANDMARALRQVSRLTLLVQNLLDVSRMQAHKFALIGDADENDLCAVVRDVLEMLQPQVAAAGCEAELAPCESVRGVWDQLRIEQVIHNLVTNAIKYASAGKKIHIRVERDVDRDLASIIVRDFGPGIPPEERARIFEPFERGRAAGDSVATHSLGLGLYIVREIIAAHGGTIAIESPEGGGTAFVVKLPVHRPPTETTIDGQAEEDVTPR